MPISGLVVTLVEDPHRAEAALAAIANEAHFELGPRHDRQVSVVLDTPDRELDKRCWQRLNDLSAACGTWMSSSSTSMVQAESSPAVVCPSIQSFTAPRTHLASPKEV